MIAGSKQIANYLSRYYRSSSFNATYVVTIVAMLAAILYAHYGDATNIATNYLPAWLQRYLLYFIPFLVAYLLQLFFFGRQDFLYNKRFWTILLLAPAFFTLRVHAGISSMSSAFIKQNAITHFYSLQFLLKSLALLLPTALYWFYLDGRACHHYGLKRTPGLAVYGKFILLMMPFLWMASLQPSFLEQYPRVFKGLASINNLDWMQWLPFELAYAFNFLSIEFFFRSFLILSLLRLAGAHAVIPAACFYCCIHLDKPLGEAISSFFGGWLLGIISYNTKSIWGGWLVHVGIAWLMELFALLQHQ